MLCYARLLPGLFYGRLGEVAAYELVRNSADRRGYIGKLVVFFVAEWCKDKICRRIARLVVVGNAHPNAREVLAYMGNKAFNAIVACVAAAKARAHGAERQGKFVVDYQDVGIFELVKIFDCPGCFAGEVVVRGRFGQDNFLPLHLRFGYNCFELVFLCPLSVMRARQVV